MHHLLSKGWEAVGTSDAFHIDSSSYSTLIRFADFSLSLSLSNKVQIIREVSGKNNESSHCHHSNCGHGPIRISHVRKCRFCRCAKRDECKVRVCEYSYECLFVFAFPCTLFSTLFPSLHPCAMRQTAGNFPLNVLDTRDFQWGNRRRARGCCRGYFLLAGYGSCSCSRLNRWRCICVAAYLACYLSDRMRW